MSSLTAVYAVQDISAEYWLEITEDGLQDATVPIEEAAEVIDQLFDLDPCENPDDLVGGEEADTDEDGEIKPPMTKEEYWQWVNSKLLISSCNAANQPRTEILIITRSHATEPYRLNLSNGRIISTVSSIENVRRKIAVDGEQDITIKANIISGNFSFQQARGRDGGILPSVPVTVQGSTLYFPGKITGILNASYSQAVDRVTISIPNTADGEPGECEVLALYAGGAYDYSVQPPVLEDIDGEGQKNIVSRRH